jgi:HEAT repeat protein/predicted MFS family arabinose efflux permease
VHALLGLRPGEGRTVALAVAVVFLVDAAIMIAQSSIDALFFARYGVERLPIMYLLVGVAMFVTTVGVGALLARFGRSRAFLVIPALISVTAVLGRAALEKDATWVYTTLWIVQSVAEFTGLLSVWGLAGLIADTRQAKRFFPVIAAGGVVGLVVGGVATGPLAATLGSENLLLVWAGLMGGATVVAWRLVRTRAAPEIRRRRGRTRGLVGAFGDVAGSPLLRSMSAGSLFTAFLFSLLYLPFVKAAAERYPDPDELAGFFGLFFALAMGTALVLSLLVTSRLLTKFGVPTVVLVLPLLYLVAFGVLAVAATFATLALFRFAQVAWRSGGAGSTWEALVNTIPAERRDRVRAFLTGVPTQLGTALAGVVALVGQRLEEPRVLYGAGAAGAVAAVASISRIREAYPHALVAALREGRPTVFGAGGGPQPAVLNADAVGLAVLEELLADHEVAARLLAAHALGDLDLPEATRALGRAVEDDDAEVRMAALASLERLDGAAATAAAATRVFDSDAAVRLAALGVLARYGTAPSGAVLDDQDLEVRAVASAMLFDRDRRAQQILDGMVHAPDPAARAIAYGAIAEAQVAGARSLALEGLRDPQAAVRAEAARAAAATAQEAAVEPLVALLADHDARVRDAAADALARLPLEGAAERVRRFASDSVALALEDARLRSRLGTSDEDAFKLLRDSLRTREERHTLDALRAASLLGGRATVSAALESLTVADPAQRATAIEVIDTVGEPAIVRPLLALWEPRPVDGFDPAVLGHLRNDSDNWIRACAERASVVSEGGAMTHTLTYTVPLVERVIFLRKVPLFGALPPQDLQPIAAVAEEYLFPEGEMLAAVGEPGDTMYVIVDGEVQVLGGDEQELAVFGPGDFIGEMAVISSKPRAASLLAKSAVHVLELRKPAFEAILRERPETALAMMRVLCERLASTAAPPR